MDSFPVDVYLSTKPGQLQYSNYLSGVYSEELYPVSEAEHDEVMALMADENEGMSGYGEWAASLDQPAASENFVVVNGRLQHKPEPPSRGRIGGIEL